MCPRRRRVGHERSPGLAVELDVEAGRRPSEPIEVGVEVIDDRPSVGIGDDPGGVETPVASRQAQVVGAQHRSIGIVDDSDAEQRNELTDL